MSGAAAAGANGPAKGAANGATGAENGAANGVATGTGANGLANGVATGTGANGVAIAWFIVCELYDDAYGKIPPNATDATIDKTTKT